MIGTVNNILPQDNPHFMVICTSNLRQQLYFNESTNTCEKYQSKIFPWRHLTLALTSIHGNNEPRKLIPLILLLNEGKLKYEVLIMLMSWEMTSDLTCHSKATMLKSTLETIWFAPTRRTFNVLKIKLFKTHLKLPSLSYCLCPGTIPVSWAE